VVLSAIGSAGKWVVQQIAERRERNARQRESMSLDTPRPATTIHSGAENDIPPFANRVPPTLERTRRTTMPSQPPVMERVMEVLLEKAAGTKLERRIRDAMPQQPAPPPPPAARSSEWRVRKPAATGGARPQKPARSMTLAEREVKRDRTRQTEVELEAQRLMQREQRFTEDTDQRLGHVTTHFAGDEVRDSISADTHEVALALDDADAVRKAFVLSELLAPPLALRPE
jgi:hypothetical protein